jgi:radical SAM protein with 4Fe4S-binding SPASM domain
LRGLSTTDTIKLFKNVVDNPFARWTLRRISGYCSACNENRLEVALQLYIGTRRDACLKCRAAKFIVERVVKSGASAFGASEEQIKTKFKDPYWRRGLVNVIRGISYFGVHKPFIPGAPFQIVWNITKLCNLRCKHCYENAGRQAPDELTTEEAITGIDRLSKAGVVSIAFSGGEPAIRPDILKLIKHASDRGIYVAMATNAIVFASRDRVKEFKEAGLDFVQISLDGLNPTTHDEFRGVPGAFEKTIEGIKNCVAEGLFTEVACVGTHFNYKEIPALVDFCDELGVDWFMLYNFIPTGRGRDIVAADLTPDEREHLLRALWLKRKTTKKVEILSTAPQYARVAKEVEAELAKAFEGSNGTTQLECDGLVIPTHFYNPKLQGELTRLADFIGGCGAGRFYVSIEPNGDIYPCVFFPHVDEVRIGNLIRDDFEELWVKSDLLRKTREKDLIGGGCKSCEYLYICGGCRARAYNYFGDILAPDPGCKLNMAYWERVAGTVKVKEVSRCQS